jgi:hypothetical protein
LPSWIQTLSIMKGCTACACRGLARLTQCWIRSNKSFVWQQIVFIGKERFVKSQVRGIPPFAYPPNDTIPINWFRLMHRFDIWRWISMLNCESWYLSEPLCNRIVSDLQSLTSAIMCLKGASIAWLVAQHIWNWGNVKLDSSFLRIPLIRIMHKSLPIESAIIKHLSHTTQFCSVFAKDVCSVLSHIIRSHW